MIDKNKTIETIPGQMIQGNVVEAPKKKLIKRDAEMDRGDLIVKKFTDSQMTIIRNTVAKGLTDDELAVFIYRARAYGLDPLKGEISAQLYNAADPTRRQMIVIVQRDGYLTIAHGSGQFNGLESDIIWQEGKPVGAWAKAWNKSAEFPVSIKVYMQEYNSQKNVWATKPLTMIQKVAESQALRKAFNISGVYTLEEVESWDGTPRLLKSVPESADDGKPATEAQITTVKAVGGEAREGMTQGEAKQLINMLTSKK